MRKGWCASARWRGSRISTSSTPWATVATSVVVQKEAFLREERNSNGKPGFTEILREHYAAVAASDQNHELFQRQHFPSPVGDLNLLGDPQISGVRCVGTRVLQGHSRRRTPLMHNKVLTFAKLFLEPAPGQENEEDPDGKIRWEPVMVWTGSFNLSRSASRSRENAVIIRDPKIASAYFRECLDLLALSERLDWESEEIDPEWHQDT